MNHNNSNRLTAVPNVVKVSLIDALNQAMDAAKACAAARDKMISGIDLRRTDEAKRGVVARRETAIKWTIEYRAHIDKVKDLIIDDQDLRVLREFGEDIGGGGVGKVLAVLQVRIDRLTKPSALPAQPPWIRTGDQISNSVVAAQIRPCLRKAFTLLGRAKHEILTADDTKSFVSDDEAYDWLKKNSEETDDLPERQTFKRYLRAARKLVGELPQRSTRAGRTGRSIIRASETDF